MQRGVAANYISRRPPGCRASGGHLKCHVEDEDRKEEEFVAVMLFKQIQGMGAIYHFAFYIH